MRAKEKWDGAKWKRLVSWSAAMFVCDAHDRSQQRLSLPLVTTTRTPGNETQIIAIRLLVLLVTLKVE